MVFIKQCNLKEFKFYKIYTKNETLIFDYPASIYGKNHQFASFKCPPNSLKFILNKQNCMYYVFVSNSTSLGPLFIKNVERIYITKPVYEQIILKYEQYNCLGITYDEDFDAINPEINDIQKNKKT